MGTGETHCDGVSGRYNQVLYAVKEEGLSKWVRSAEHGEVAGGLP